MHTPSASVTSMFDFTDRPINSIGKVDRTHTLKFSTNFLISLALWSYAIIIVIKLHV